MATPASPAYRILDVKARGTRAGLYAYVHHPETGARRQLTFPSPEDAQRIDAILYGKGYAAAMAEYDGRTHQRGDRSAQEPRTVRTFVTLAQEYLEDREHESTRATYAKRLVTVSRFPLFRTREARTLTVRDLEAFITWCEVSALPRTGKPMARSTRYVAWAFVSQVLKWGATRYGWTNRAAQVERPPRQPKPAEHRQAATIVGDDEVVAILKEWTDPDPAHAVLFYRLLYATGLRYGEAAALRPEDLTLPRRGDVGAIHVERTWKTPRKGPQYVGETKSHEVRDLWVPRVLVEELAALTPSPTGYLFPLRSKYRPWWADLRAKAAARGAAPATVRLHDLRHSHITNLLEDGESLHEVSRRAGHADVHFTFNRYGHVRNDAAMAMGARVRMV